MNHDSATREVCLAWAFLPFLTPARVRLLLEYFDPLPAACNASSKLLQELLNVDADQAELVRNPLRIPLPCAATTLGDADYPDQLRRIIDPPVALFYRGDLALAERSSIAMVGSRKASPYALNAAAHIARQLVSAGLVIVSGLARGIDSASHAAALQAGGTTIAVLGTGIDIVYPPENRKLFGRIADQGLIVTEFPPKTPPFAQNFPIRNRVISGISAATIIVEATGRSGSLITARTAAEQGREVGAVPGSIFSPGSEGTHRLVQYGAKLVHEANDILVELEGKLRIPPQAPPEPPPPELAAVLEVFNRESGTHMEWAADQLRRPINELSESLLQLELGGWLRALPGSRYVRVK